MFGGEILAVIFFRCSDCQRSERPQAEDIYLFLSTLMEVLNVDARDDNLKIEHYEEVAKSMSVSPRR